MRSGDDPIVVLGHARAAQAVPTVRDLGLATSSIGGGQALASLWRAL